MWVSDQVVGKPMYQALISRNSALNSSLFSWRVVEFLSTAVRPASEASPGISYVESSRDRQLWPQDKQPPPQALMPPGSCLPRALEGTGG